MASPMMSNEDLFALKQVLDRRGITQVAFRVPPRTPGYEDDLLIRADKNPNTRGAELIGLDGDARQILAAARAKRIRVLWVLHHDLFGSEWTEGEIRAALSGVQRLIFSGTNANRTSALAHLVLPTAAWVEREGTFTNFQGRVQRFRQAITPVGEALADWDLLGRLDEAQRQASEARRAEHWFRDLAAVVPAFAGLSYRSIGDAGQMAAMREGRADAPEVVTA
jgi:predicted molibdopterin-dependent oxidoreductase YjgC